MKPFLFVFAAFFLIGGDSFAQTLDTKKLKGIKVRNIGPAGMSGRVTSIDVVLSEPDIIYAGTASGGLWRSNNGGTQWTPLFDEQPVQSIGAVTIQQSNPDVIWAGTGEGNPRNSHTSGGGLYKSIDGGATWKLMGLEKTFNIHRIIVHRDKPNTVFVAALGSVWGANEDRGIFRTTDGGKTWKKVLYNNDLTGCADMIVDPSNPDKIIAGMWEFYREPWFFTSGGKGSGLYVTFDGGDNWTKRTEEDGLPKGELGRIGLTISHSSPNVVYALVEAETTGLYRSDDGGKKWKKVADKNIGNRPFYYADIYVDPQNENRIYNLHSIVTKSEDGGKTFKTMLPYWGVHPDHHAWWIHPNDPNYIIDGNDGGLNISRDRGKTWRFVENIPVGQFYHINTDNDVPYNVYGGMQDNGSWIGPGYVWQSGGIRNHHWQEILFGDGFDVMPHPDNNRYGYAMYQGGNLHAYDAETGHSQYIQPFHPEGLPLRFNWNAALAQNPFHTNGIYFGSQYLHKSMDGGKSWNIISPDLTTNDSTKQQQHKSGGLTIDATRAENFTTITAIAPSPKDENVIWVGSDDGRLHLTRDGGTTWEDLYSRMKGLPAGSWIPQIEASTHSAGEAYVIINNYRRNDWKPYVYRTTDFGKKWTRIADEIKVDGHCHAIVQDPVAPNLLFLGTEHGLFVSIDAGTNWTKWTEKYPSVPTIDLKIHPREHDLIIGTFGRAAWVMDNILPLRALAQEGVKIMDEPLHAFAVPDAYLASTQSAAGVRFYADAHFRGQNKPSGALINVWIKEKLEKAYKDSKGKKVKPALICIDILKANGDTVRHFKGKVESDGLIRVRWDLDEDGYRYPEWKDRDKDEDPPRGRSTIPGTYKIIVTYGEHKSETSVDVLPDPRLNITTAQYDAYAAFMDDHKKLILTANEAFNRMKEAQKVVNYVNSQLQYADSTWRDSLQSQGKKITKKLKELTSLFVTPQDFKGYDHVTERLGDHLSKPTSYVNSVPEEISPAAKSAEAFAKKELELVLVRVNAFFGEEWTAYRKAVEAAQLTPFKELPPLEIKD